MRQAAYEVSNLELAIVNLTMTNIRYRTLGSMELDEMLSSATALTPACCTLSMRPPTRGIKVTRIEIRDVRPPAELIAQQSPGTKAERTGAPFIWKLKVRQAEEHPKRRGNSRRSRKRRRRPRFLQAEARELKRPKQKARATQMVSEAPPVIFRP